MSSDPSNLPEIPLITKPTTVREIFDSNHDAANDMIGVAAKKLPGFALSIGDRVSKKWLRKANPVYKDDIDYIANALNRKGIHMLNLSYEWACTTTAINDEKAGGVKLYRALDWDIKGMGPRLMVANMKGEAGNYWSITYPGFVGALNGMAPGRFSIAINQAPLPKRGFGFIGDWLLTKTKNRKSLDMPAPFLLRQVFEKAANYDEAVKMLTETPLCVQAIFTVAGTKPGEHVVIERNLKEFRVHPTAHCVANHWITKDWKGHPRTDDSYDRRTKMLGGLAGYQGEFDWLVAPILNTHTRMAFESNASTGTMTVFGIEEMKPVTQTLKIQP